MSKCFHCNQKATWISPTVGGVDLCDKCMGWDSKKVNRNKTIHDSITGILSKLAKELEQSNAKDDIPYMDFDKKAVNDATIVFMYVLKNKFLFEAGKRGVGQDKMKTELGLLKLMVKTAVDRMTGY